MLYSAAIGSRQFEPASTLTTIVAKMPWKYCARRQLTSWGEGRLCAVIYGYFDGSNTHHGSKVLSMCGFIGDPRIWDDFVKEWQKVLDNPGWPRRPSEFHMVDCVHGNKEFRGWTLAQRLAIFGDLCGVIANSNVMALGSVFV